MHKRTYIADIEGNGFLDKLTHIWCVTFKRLSDGEIFKFRPSTPYSGHGDFANDLVRFIEEEVDYVIGHNFLTYDGPALNKIIKPNLIDPKKVIDTLVLSRLFRTQPPVHFPLYFKGRKMDDRVGGHSLSAWGKRLHKVKTEFNDWSHYTEEMGEYNTNDVEVNHLIYNELMIEKDLYGFSDESIRLEHDVTWMLHEQQEHGFYLDKAKAEKLKAETGALWAEMTQKLQYIFPPIFVHEKDLVIKTNKDGTLNRVSQKILEKFQTDPTKQAVLKEDGSYDLQIQEVFNPDSNQQIAKRLLSIGWNPKRFTDTGKPKTDRETIKEALHELLTANADKQDLKYLMDYGVVGDRFERVKKWLALAEKDGRIHGQVSVSGLGHIGLVTSMITWLTSLQWRVLSLRQ